MLIHGPNNTQYSNLGNTIRPYSSKFLAPRSYSSHFSKDPPTPHPTSGPGLLKSFSWDLFPPFGRHHQICPLILALSRRTCRPLMTEKTCFGVYSSFPSTLSYNEKRIFYFSKLFVTRQRVKYQEYKRALFDCRSYFHYILIL